MRQRYKHVVSIETTSNSLLKTGNEIEEGM